MNAGWAGSRPAEASTFAPVTRRRDCSKRVKSPTKPSVPENSPSVSPGFTTSGAAAEEATAVCSPSTFVSCRGGGAGVGGAGRGGRARAAQGVGAERGHAAAALDVGAQASVELLREPAL